MRFIVVTSLLLGSVLVRSVELKESYPRIFTPLGGIEGLYEVSNAGRLYAAYKGIPYAEPPIGDSRFRAPKPISPWMRVLNAKEFGSSCMGFAPAPTPDPEDRVTGSEDCLYLNIYAPIMNRSDGITSSANSLPIILFIHGGAFQFGTGSLYGPKYLLDYDVILVTINYRLGPLGFLSTEDETIAGNMGLKDQVIAMSWVKDNIVFFGGDPNRITIIGQSAGGASVQYHYLSKLSVGLFQRGMSISGTTLNCWAQTEGSLEKAKKLANIVGCPTNGVQDMVDCLRTRPARLITRATGDFMPWLENPATPFGPVVEKGCSDFAFIDQPPAEILASGKVQDLPWITTVVSEEGLFPAGEFMANETLLRELNDNWDYLAPFLLDFNYTIPQIHHRKVARLIKGHYLGTRQIDNSTVEQIVRMIGDRLFVYDAEEAARLQARANRNPVRFYYFTYRGAHSMSEEFTGVEENFGVSHLDDLPYVLDVIFDPTTTTRDRAMQRVMLNLWVSFASSATPELGVEWSTVEPFDEELRYLRIASPDEIRMDGNANFGDKHFWLSIPFRENIPITVTGTRIRSN
ncbi:venom carboxylesterase-6-like isoform X1 [Neodiprion fabricii]|uniref:venom carboxylesterase-6-like isoform X1 n=2 Tax=Neodiprion fabricii TaxID=2872261 RepID=UPI001ED8FA33|nr:venom carboxylesterase-6-like isoform X1 [Neodiprion fabricii]